MAWTFPTSTSAAWDSGHSWALLFTQQAQYDAFRGTAGRNFPDSLVLLADESCCTSKLSDCLDITQGLTIQYCQCVNDTSISHFVLDLNTDAFARAALLVEWQAATKARQSLSADAKTSSDDSGASAETETSRALQARLMQLLFSSMQRFGPFATGHVNLSSTPGSALL